MRRTATMWLTVFAAAALLGVSACEKKGAFEQAGEEVDEAIDTVKDGKESTATKIDDAIDEARKDAEDAADDLKK